jgi:hypothetical protein
MTYMCLQNLANRDERVPGCEALRTPSTEEKEMVREIEREKGVSLLT